MRSTDSCPAIFWFEQRRKESKIAFFAAFSDIS